MNYVGIVIISHSEQVASGLKEIIREVITDVPVEIAGGTDDGRIGTSMDKILRAIQRADEGSGVLLFYDLGSAKMNAELALDMCGNEDVFLVDAPLIEGAYVAAVESSVGNDVHTVIENVKKSFK